MSLTTAKIHADVAELLGCDPAELKPETDLTDLGLDSMRIMGLVEQWRTEGADNLEFADLAEQPTLGHWTQVLTGSTA
ncbi:acyl carrier protein [Amycolatopsis sp. WAC 04182]|uniref:phosphopantetheine-binding protein n=1 Tax=Amycolatopsis sp. WAC 04182 TaxID=2203198 RepID=UPI000F77E0FC|nr:phosphopantetheine-binding protein [Amycolatopsis sp. WAC 04182]RSN61354.1 acyl carrier protein [Amycolatopsis sp. WAC 04182]